MKSRDLMKRIRYDIVMGDLLLSMLMMMEDLLMNVLMKIMDLTTRARYDMKMLSGNFSGCDCRFTFNLSLIQNVTWIYWWSVL